MNEKYIERNQETENFEAEHRDFLEKLKYMPIEQKEKRWDFFNRYDRREDFIIELIEVYRPGAYSKIKKRLEKSEGNRLKEDSYIACWGNKEIDSTVFMEAIKDAVENYIGKNKNGEEYEFVACVGILYRQKAGTIAAENTLRQKGISDREIPRRNLPKILKMVKAAERVWIRNSVRIPKEEALKQAVEEVPYHCTRKEMELVKALFFSDNNSVVISTDNLLEAEDGEIGNTFGEQLKDERDDFEQVIEQETGSSFLEVFCQEIEERWKIITSAKDLKEQELIKIFLTQGILKELKLDENGKPYLKEPAGDEEFYCSLKPKGTFLYHQLFFKDYLWRAFIEKPEDFHAVYMRLLRMDFNFSDKILAEVTGKDKTAISKGKRRYFDLMKAIYDYCISENRGTL